jgi:hypothetical protein
MFEESRTFKNVLPGICLLIFWFSWGLVSSRSQTPDAFKFSLREQFRFVQDRKRDFNKIPLQLLRQEILKTLPAPHNTHTNVVLVWTATFRPYETNEPRHWELMIPALDALYLIHSNGIPITPLCDPISVDPWEALEKFAGMTHAQTETFLDQTGLSSDTPLGLIKTMRNCDIRWDGNIFGLTARPTGPTRKLLKQSSEVVAPLLLEALKDKDRYVAAHLALTQIRLKSYSISAAKWNGLSVELLSDGQTVIPDQQSAILRYWSNKNAARSSEK